MTCDPVVDVLVNRCLAAKRFESMAETVVGARLGVEANNFLQILAPEFPEVMSVALVGVNAEFREQSPLLREAGDVLDEAEFN